MSKTKEYKKRGDGFTWAGILLLFAVVGVFVTTMVFLDGLDRLIGFGWLTTIAFTAGAMGITGSDPGHYRNTGEFAPATITSFFCIGFAIISAFLLTIAVRADIPELGMYSLAALITTGVMTYIFALVGNKGH